MLGVMQVSPQDRPRRATIVLVLLIGACLLSLGLGGDPVNVALWMGGTLLFWTSLLPRLPAMKGGEIWVAGHGLGAAAFWCALGVMSGRWPLISGQYDFTRVVRATFAFGMLSAGFAVGFGWAVDRAARRAPRTARRVLSAVLALELIALAIVLPAVRGDAPSGSERLHDQPVVAHLAADATSLDSPVRLARFGQGDFVTLLDERAAAADGALPPASRDYDHVVALFPQPGASLHVCVDLEWDDGPLEVREFEFRGGPRVAVITPEHALDGDDVDPIEGCVFDGVRGFRWRIDVRNVRHPVRGSRSTVPVAIAALVVAVIQIGVVLAAWLRHRRLRRALSGTSDGEGRVTLENGLIVDLAAPLGPVLVTLAEDAKATYRSGAKPTARLLASESRASADERMDLSTCIALVAAVGTLAVAVLPLVTLLAQNMVAPF